jgi:hypothetical protein
MNNRQRILAILNRQMPDRIPWIPRLELWYNARCRQGNLPEAYRGLTLRQLERKLGMGTPAREGSVYRTIFRNVEVKSETRGDQLLTWYITPLGKVFTANQASATLEDGGIYGKPQTSHMIKEAADYPVAQFIVEHTEYLPAYDAYHRYDEQIGEDGLPMIHVGQEPMYRILQDLVGYNDAYFHLQDYRPQVMKLYDALMEKALEMQAVVLDSPGVLFLHGEHFDAQMTPPPVFRQYMLPYFQSFAEKLHARGKFLVCHADADTSNLLELIRSAGYDMAECFVSRPMVRVTLAEARQAWGNEVSIWGGLPSVLLCDPYTDEEFETAMRQMFQDIAPGNAFILGVADNVMAETHFERILRVGEMLDNLRF